MANGMAESAVLSRRNGGLSIGSSLLKPPEPGGTMLVGDGSTSVSRFGGPLCDSLLQIALPHGNDTLPA